MKTRAKYLKELFRSDISNGSLGPRDFVILVKQKVVDYLSELDSVPQNSDVNVRNEGDIQDILAEQLVGILISFLRLGSMRRSPEHWTECTETVVRVRGLDINDTSEGRQLEQRAWEASLHP